jgi:hypothetical protein
VKQDKEVSVAEIWEQLRAIIEGYYDEKKPHEYQTLEYGTIYNNTISNILEHTFGGRSKHRTFGNTFIFDLEELTRVGKAYNLSTDIQTKIIDVEQNTITKDEGMKAPSPLGEPSTLQQDENEAQNQEGVPSIEPSEPSEPSNNKKEESSNTKHKHNADFSSGKWHCNDCKATGDRFYMGNTDCTGGPKK